MWGKGSQTDVRKILSAIPFGRRGVKITPVKVSKVTTEVLDIFPIIFDFRNFIRKINGFTPLIFFKVNFEVQTMNSGGLSTSTSPSLSILTSFKGFTFSFLRGG
jgi:hypothetical protein